MRFPPFEDLDEEQRHVYGFAPVDENILIVGAPGTGKTITNAKIKQQTHVTTLFDIQSIFIITLIIFKILINTTV